MYTFNLISSPRIGLTRLFIVFSIIQFFNINSFCQKLTKGNTYAIVVGISNYNDDKIKDLNYAHKDAEAFANFLSTPGGGKVPNENIKLLINEDATISNIYASLKSFQNKLKENDLLYFYFSGHGDVEEGLYELGFLLAHDTPHKNYLTNAIRFEDINMIANTLSIKKDVKVVLITDACHSGKLLGNNRGAMFIGEQLSKVQKNEIRLASCEAEQLSQEGSAWGGGRGVFSFYLINGLSGFADADGDDADGIITVDELKRYLEKKVSSDVRKIKNEFQNPVVSGKNHTPISIVDELNLKSISDNPSDNSSNLSSKSVQYVKPPIDVYFKCLAQGNLIGNANWMEWQKMSNKKIIKLALDEFEECENKYIKKSTWRKDLQKNKQLKAEYGLFLASLIHNNVQEILNKHITYDKEVSIPKEIDTVMFLELDKCIAMLETGIKLIPQEDRLYKILKLKSYFITGLSARLKLPYSSNPDSLITIAKESFEKAMAIEDKAAYVRYEMSFVTTYKRTTGGKTIRRKKTVRRNTKKSRTIKSVEN